jgi:hypothetical protein
MVRRLEGEKVGRARESSGDCSSRFSDELLGDRGPSTRTVAAKLRCMGIARRLRMELYDFEVLCGDEVITAERAVPLHSPRAAWPRILRLARNVNSASCRIRVKERGETIILVGASAALLYADFDFSEAA